MASVTAPTDAEPSQPQAEFVKAMTLTDATMLVAGIAAVAVAFGRFAASHTHHGDP